MPILKNVVCNKAVMYPVDHISHLFAYLVFLPNLGLLVSHWRVELPLKFCLKAKLTLTDLSPKRISVHGIARAVYAGSFA